MLREILSGQMGTVEWVQLLLLIPIILFSLSVHESAHAYVAHKLGDDTARNFGRITLNPAKHFDPVGFLFLLLFGFGWAKPVPVNPNNFRNKSRDMMLTAIAGPASNLVAAFLGVIVIQLFGFYNGGFTLEDADTKMEYVFTILYYFTVINLNLCLFNMIPVPPLDGSRVLTYLLPPRAAVWMMRNQRYFYGVVMILMITGILTWPLNLLNRLLLSGMLTITDWIPAVFG